MVVGTPLPAIVVAFAQVHFTLGQKLTPFCATFNSANMRSANVVSHLRMPHREISSGQAWLFAEVRLRLISLRLANGTLGHSVTVLYKARVHFVPRVVTQCRTISLNLADTCQTLNPSPLLSLFFAFTYTAPVPKMTD